MKPYALFAVLASGLPLLLATACATAPKPDAAVSPTTTPTSSPRIQSAEIVAEDADPVSNLVVDRPRVDEPDPSARAVANAESVLKGIEPDLLACYTRRVAVSPQAHAYMTVDIVIAPDGHVQGVETTGGALLGDRTLACITKTIERATFEPPHNGGTLRIHVPMTLRKAAPDETP